MKRQRSKQRARHDAPIIERIQSIKSDHPFWEYRRIWTYMRVRNGIIIGKKQSLSIDERE